MQEFWTHYAHFYGWANDLEEKQRLFVADFLREKKGDLLEFACGNGKVISNIREAGFQGSILWVDYNREMIEVARERLPHESFLQGDILEAESFLGDTQYDFVLCLNSLHNLPDKSMIYAFLETMRTYTKPGGYIIFDVRNTMNPGVNYGYYQNRKKWLEFHTLIPKNVVRLFWDDFELLTDMGITYTQLPDQKNILTKFVYSLYHHLIRWKVFSPYRLFIFRKK